MRESVSTRETSTNTVTYHYPLDTHLNVLDLLGRELELIQSNLSRSEILQESKLLGHEKEKGLSFTLGSARRPPYSEAQQQRRCQPPLLPHQSGIRDHLSPVDVVACIIRRIVLHNPVDEGNV